MDIPIEFEQAVQDALEALPRNLRGRISNVAVVVEDEPPPGMRVLGLYQGVPLSRRGHAYGGVLPDRITIYRGPLERLYGSEQARLRSEISRSSCTTRAPLRHQR